MCSGQVFAILLIFIMQSPGGPQSTTVNVLMALMLKTLKQITKGYFDHFRKLQ
jgi:hypothetical protein